ncbi:MAG: hypothetical protein ACREDT_13775 [Methylocella sp.]
MKPVSVLILITVLGYLVIPARAETQQFKCVSDGPEKLDMLMHGVTLGSALLVVADFAIAVGSRGRASAAVLASSAAAYAVVKDYVAGKETTTCTLTNPSHSETNFVFVGHGSEFRNTTDTERRLKSADIVHLNLVDEYPLKRTENLKRIEKVFPRDEKFSSGITFDDFRSAGNSLSPIQTHRLTELLRDCSEKRKSLGRCPGSQAGAQ